MAITKRRKQVDQNHHHDHPSPALLPGLPDHITHLCLSLLHPSSLYSVCRSWRLLIYSPSFPPFLSSYLLHRFTDRPWGVSMCQPLSRKFFCSSSSTALPSPAGVYAEVLESQLELTCKSYLAAQLAPWLRPQIHLAGGPTSATPVRALTQNHSSMRTLVAVIAEVAPARPCLPKPANDVASVGEQVSPHLRRHPRCCGG
jgi:hypothetical protein